MTDIDLEALKRATSTRYRRDVEDIARRLHLLADEVAQIGIPGESLRDPGLLEYTRSASNIAHRVIWGVANLSLDSMVRSAAEAELAQRGETL